MDIVISVTSETPIYRQIYEQVRAQILRGELCSDACLPAIRTVAKELRISVITIKKAWEELERQGLIYTITGKGCFVAPMAAGALDVKRDAFVTERLDRDIAYYRSLGLGKEELIAYIERAFDGDQ